MPLPAKNLLDLETSPYLLQHKDNPVHWRAWGPEALAESRASNKPILLSVGYAACHWCHVMAHESFENPTTAAVMNKLFVNIKVDREERPDIDGIYQSALQLLGEQGGWPLTMFLTPDAEPFWGGTYFPPEAKFGRPAFVDILLKVSEVFRTQPRDIAENAAKLKNALDGMGQPRKGALVPVSILDQVADRILREFDMEHGGLGSAPKFPHSSHFELMWRAHLRSSNKAYGDAVTLSLEKMSQGGIYDHLGGGFARYATDQKWLVPHFEKMLYDNAQLIETLTLVWQETRQPLFAQRVEETVQWLAREMIAESGAFGATLDADSEHEEGKFYVWTEAEVDDALADVPPQDMALFEQVYDVSEAGNWEGKIILNRTTHSKLLGDDEEAALARLRAKLLAARAGRVRPGWDDKVLADWNGMMIAALAFASGVFDRADWLDMAKRAYDVVLDKLGSNNETGGDRLSHSYRAGKVRGAGMIDDYAQMARAALALFEATGDKAYIAQAERWVDALDAHFWDDTAEASSESESGGGGYFFTADDAEGLILRRREAQDHATPSGNAVIAGVLARLFYLTGEEAYRARAEDTISAFAGEIARNFFPLPTLLNANQFLQHGVQIVLVGSSDQVKPLRAAVDAVSLPDRVIQTIAPGDVVPANHPANGKGMVDGKAAAYVCVGPTCTLPITDPAQLTETLKATRAIK